MTRTTMKPRASLTVRIVLAVMAALLVMAALWAIVNLAAVNSYNQATQSLPGEHLDQQKRRCRLGQAAHQATADGRPIQRGISHEAAAAAPSARINRA